MSIDGRSCRLTRPIRAGGGKAHDLMAGDTHLVIVENDKPIRYCPAAAVEILDLAQRDLDALRRALGL